MARKLQPLPLPNWFHEMARRTRAGEIFAVPYQQIAQEAQQYKKQVEAQGFRIESPVNDVKKFGFVIIDGQLTFCDPSGELYVPGSPEDSIRTAEFILMWAYIITRIALTLDTHTMFQIFHQIFWINAQGEHPQPFTTIKLADIKAGVWTINPAVLTALDVSAADMVRWVMFYCATLEANGQYELMIWPYHAMLGGINHALVPIIEAACFWWGQLRGAQYHIEVKGGNPYTEMYGAIMAEVGLDKDGNVIATPQIGFLRHLAEMQYIGFAGQAYTHCVASSMRQLHTLASDPANSAQHLLDKLRVFKNLSSPVQGFEANVPKIDAELVQKGFLLVNSTDDIETILA